MSSKIGFKILSLLIMSTIITTPAYSQENDIVLYFGDLDLITQDGVINLDEYTQTLIVPNHLGDFTVARLSWSHNATHLAVGLNGINTGFIALGFNTVPYTYPAMGSDTQSANMIIAWISADELTIQDYYSNQAATPTLDTDQYDTLAQAAGMEENGNTYVEFIIPLDSSDDSGQDIDLVVGTEYQFFIAGHESSDLLGYHGDFRSQPYSFTISDEGVNPETNEFNLLAAELPSFSAVEITFVVLFFGGIILLMRRNKITARY